MAEKWSKVTIPPSPTNPIPITPLSRISHLVLLDLLGSANPVIHSWFKNTGWLFDEFLLSEKKLGEAGVLWSSQNGSGTNYESTKNEIFSTMRSFFIDRMNSNYGYHTLGGIEDDHLPFLKAGIPVVHLIASPFPEVWHTLKDDKSALDLDTIKAWALIVRLTVAEYLGLDPAIKEKSKRKEERVSHHEL